ncbi:MAG: VanZ family protein [Bacteroidia bacterium]|nr:VanZ family protein [Bacteroidia bacterium]
MVLQHIKIYKYAYLWAIIATGLCGTNGNNIPQFSFSNLIGIDKLAHMLLFGTETFLIAIASKKIYAYKSSFHTILPAFIIGTVFGIIIEILQATLFTNRSFDYLDMLANTIGCALAWLILTWKFNKK